MTAKYQQNRIKVDKLIDFGDVMVNSSEIRRVIVSNLSGALPIKISFDQMSNFSTHPKSISIPPGCQELVNVIFAPRQGGHLSQKWKLTYSHGPLKFARRVVELTGSGVMLQKVPARKSEVPYVTNLNEFNGDFTYTPSERADELNRKEFHNQDSFHDKQAFSSVHLQLWSIV